MRAYTRSPDQMTHMQTGIHDQTEYVHLTNREQTGLPQGDQRALAWRRDAGRTLCLRAQSQASSSISGSGFIETHLHLCRHTQRHTCAHTDWHTHGHLHTNTHTHTHTHTHSRMHAQTHIHTNIKVHAHIHTY